MHTMTTFEIPSPGNRPEQTVAKRLTLGTPKGQPVDVLPEAVDMPKGTQALVIIRAAWSMAVTIANAAIIAIGRNANGTQDIAVAIGANSGITMETKMGPFWYSMRAGQLRIHS